MNTDAELLRRFVDDRSEAAFTELVQRHLPLVRATALRRVGGDVHAADDVTQQVFVALARKAPSLRDHAALPGWLYLSTHHATASWVRQEQRRKQRETAAHSMQLADSSPEPSAEAEQLRPLLDDALVSLKPDERDAIVLRFFSNRTFTEIGHSLALSEDAARKRVDRALEKLQALLARRGVTSTAVALGAVLMAAGVQAAPAGLAVRVAGAALAQAAAPGVLATAANVFWPAATAAALVGGTLVLVPQHRANADAEAALAARESALSIAQASVQNETHGLERDLTQAHRAAATRTRAVVAAPVSAKTVAPAAASAVGAPAVVISVSPQGALKWGDDAVTLDEFLERILRHQAEAPNGGARIEITARGARFQQLNWVLDEARKAGIGHMVVDTDAAPVGPMSTWF